MAPALKTLTIKNMLTPYNFTDKNSLSRNKFIVVHYFGSLGTAKSVAEYFASAYRGASAHLDLDETKTVWRSVADEDVAWHCGTTGTYYHASCRNSNSIGIEVRPYILDKTKSADASYKGWYFGQEVEDNLVELVRYLMELYSIPAENVIRHYDVTHKYCPRPWMGSDTNVYYQTTGDVQWLRFKARLSETTINIEIEEDDEMDYAGWKEFMSQYRKELQDNDSGTWSKEARQWALDQGLMVGGGTTATGEANFMWEDMLTREQAAQLFYRFAQLMGKA